MYTRFPRRCYLEHVIGASFECVEWRRVASVLWFRRTKAEKPPYSCGSTGVIPLERNFVHSLSVVLSAEPGRK